jgi:protein-S-isoprenylcysteine O-methyltransferase Ste14
MSNNIQPTAWQRIARRIRVPLGFLFAIVFLWCAQSSVESILLSLLFVVPGLALRAYASGCVKKNAELATSGPYAYTRNPLYLGSLLMGLGFALASMRAEVFMAICIFYILIYDPTIRSEERYLRDRFPEFEAYARRVPRLLPRLTPVRSKQAPSQFSAALYLRHREYNALVGALALYAALSFRMLYATR